MFYRFYMLLPKKVRRWYWNKIKHKAYIELEAADGSMVDITPYIKSYSFDGEQFDTSVDLGSNKQLRNRIAGE